MIGRQLTEQEANTPVPVKVAHTLTGIPPRTLWRWIAEGRLEHTGERREYLVTAAAVWAASRTTAR